MFFRPSFRPTPRRIASVCAVLAAVAVPVAFACSIDLFEEVSVSSSVRGAETGKIAIRHAANVAVARIVKNDDGALSLSVTRSVRGSIPIGATAPFEPACDSCWEWCYAVGDSVVIASDAPLFPPGQTIGSHPFSEGSYVNGFAFWRASDESTASFLARPSFSSGTVSLATLSADTERVRAALQRSLARDGSEYASCISYECTEDEFDAILTRTRRMDARLSEIFVKVGALRDRLREENRLSPRDKAILDIAARTIERKHEELGKTERKLAEISPRFR